MEYTAKDKYYALKRAYKRFETISTNNGNQISNSGPRDIAEDFFNQCFHFKDWLKRDASIVLTKNVETFIDNSNAICLAADFCNFFKHGGHSRNTRSGKRIEKINTHIKIDHTPTGFVSSGRLELTISGKKYDAFTLATDCMKEWEDFLKQNQIEIPDP